MENIDKLTVDSFGDEWNKFDQNSLSDFELKNYFNNYFSIFPWDLIDSNSEGFDMGCGSGRWARLVAPKVKILNCIDPSNAINVAKKNLKNHNNIIFIRASADNNNIKFSSQDFGYSIGVLHHIPDTQQAIDSCVKLLKPGAPFLVYLYYSFDNRSFIYKFVWMASNILRFVLSKTNPNIKKIFCDIIAIFIYLPISRLSLVMEFFNFNIKNIPLSFYRRSSIYTMRTDSRDRFGTPLEKRFSKKQIFSMLKNSGLENIVFSDKEPFWCAVGTKKRN